MPLMQVNYTEMVFFLISIHIHLHLHYCRNHMMQIILHYVILGIDVRITTSYRKRPYEQVKDY